VRVGSPSPDDARLVRENDRLGTIAERQLHEETVHMRLDRGHAQHESLSDLSVGQASTDQLEDFSLAFGERVELARRRAG
jgi:hypothetical protein